jgi:hypothetical protein
LGVPPIVVDFAIRGPGSHPRLEITTEVHSTGGSGSELSASPPPSGGPWSVGPVTISTDDGAQLTYWCEQTGP